MNIGFHPRPASSSSLRNLCALSVSALSFSLSRRSSRTVGSVPAPRFLSCFALPLSCKTSQKLTPLISHSSALFKKEHSADSFGISAFRTLLQITGGVPAPFFSFLPLLTTHDSLFTNSFRICSCGKTPTGEPAASISPEHFLFFPHRVNMRRAPTPVYPEQARGATRLLSCVYFTVLWIPGGAPLLIHRQCSPLHRPMRDIPSGRTST